MDENVSSLCILGNYYPVLSVIYFGTGRIPELTHQLKIGGFNNQGKSPEFGVMLTKSPPTIFINKETAF